METKWTKGPWMVGSYKGVLNGDIHEALSIWPPDAVQGKSGRHVCLIGPLAVMDDLDIANAQLIAAAPELYEALELAWPALRRCGYSDDSREIKAIEAAMTKARGE
jgi:hypothetical protein